MIYIIAIILGLVACIQGYASEIVNGNISHLKNGRKPNAGACIFPTFPATPLTTVLIAWLLDTFIPDHALKILIMTLASLSLLSLVAYIRARKEYSRLSTGAKVLE